MTKTRLRVRGLISDDKDPTTPDEMWLVRFHHLMRNGRVRSGTRTSTTLRGSWLSPVEHRNLTITSIPQCRHRHNWVPRL